MHFIEEGGDIDRYIDDIHITAFADGAANMIAEQRQWFPERLRIDHRIAGEQFVNFRKAAASVGDVQFTPLDGIGGH